MSSPEEQLYLTSVQRQIKQWPQTKQALNLLFTDTSDTLFYLRKWQAMNDKEHI